LLWRHYGGNHALIRSQKNRLVSGIVQASARIGDALMSPSLAAMNAAFGVRLDMPVLCLPLLITIPVVLWIDAQGRKASVQTANDEPKAPIAQMVKRAFKSHDYRLLLLSFSTCGFNMSIIESHLFPQVLSYGLDSRVASLALTVYGMPP